MVAKVSQCIEYETENTATASVEMPAAESREKALAAVKAIFDRYMTYLALTSTFPSRLMITTAITSYL